MCTLRPWTCWWAAARVPAAAACLTFDPRAARKVMETAGPALAQDVVDLSAGPLRILLGQRQGWFVRVERGAVLTIAGSGETGG
eukprot:7628542-Alexandrium_andersonii.AAC.1